jgi:hypothetical protein
VPSATATTVPSATATTAPSATATPATAMLQLTPPPAPPTPPLTAGPEVIDASTSPITPPAPPTPPTAGLMITLPRTGHSGSDGGSVAGGVLWLALAGALLIVLGGLHARVSRPGGRRGRPTVSHPE